MFPRILAFVPLLIVTVAHAEDPAISKIRQAVTVAWKKGRVPGLSLAIVKDGKVIFAEGFGWADVSRKRRATADTVYEIGSSTKAFTALLAAQAAQEGKLSLKDRPVQYLPGFRLKDPNANAKITIEDMLSHRSGLPRTDLAWYVGSDYTGDDLLRIAAEAAPTAPLGARFQYQNLMFAFAGMIEAKVYGKSFDALLTERFFRPLGMDHSGSTYAATRAEAELATGYSGSGASDPLPLKPIDRISPAGSISSSVRDMAKYLQMLLANGQFEGKQVFTNEAIEETRKPRIPLSPGNETTYGLGWMLGKSHGVKSVFHGGNIDGFSAMVSLLPSEGLGVVALSNGNVASLPQEAVDIVYDALGPKEEKGDGTPVANFEEASDADLGSYHLDQPSVDLIFTREGKTIVMDQNGQKIPLKLVGPRRYAFQNAIFFTFNVEGKPAVKLEQAGMTFMLKPAVPYRSSISVAELSAKMVEARGGAETLRRHTQVVVRYRGALPSDAIDAYGIRYRRDPVSVADYTVLFALGRRLGDTTKSVDGVTSVSKTSFSKLEIKTGPEVSDELIGGALESEITPERFYASVVVAREDKIGEIPVYVLVKTNAAGTKIAEFVSQKDFRVLRREVRKGARLSREDYSDFRVVDGETIPYRTDAMDQDSVKSSEEILSVRYDERVPEWPFGR